MEVNKLVQIAKLLDSVPVKEFNLGIWGKEGDVCATEENECGFAGCAIGWVAHSKMFEGFTLKEVDHFLLGSSLQPAYGRLRGTDAVGALLGLTGKQVVHLFMPDSYPSEERTRPSTVAKRIRKTVHDHCKAEFEAEKKAA